MNIHLTPKSANAKTGPIPVSTSPPSTCPDACPLKSRGCYAKSGPLALHWRAVDNGRGIPWAAFLDAVRAFPEGQLWRHNQAGDLPGEGDRIDGAALSALAGANRGRRGFTYSHKPATGSNLRALRAAVRAGFTINLSADSLAEADTLAGTGLPVACIVPTGTAPKTRTPEGRPVIVCPAQLRDGVSCSTCGLCAKASRPFIIGFLPHGTGAKAADAIARQ